MVRNPLPSEIVVVTGGYLHLLTDQAAGSRKGFRGVTLPFPKIIVSGCLFESRQVAYLKESTMRSAFQKSVVFGHRVSIENTGCKRLLNSIRNDHVESEPA